MTTINMDAITQDEIDAMDYKRMLAIDRILRDLVEQQLKHFKEIDEYSAEQLGVMSHLDVQNATIAVEKLVATWKN